MAKRTVPTPAPEAQVAGVKPGRPKGRPTQEGAGVGRQVIVDRALELLRTTHPAKISLSSVARAAGCDPALVRYYFTDLQGVLVAAAAAISEHMHQKAAAALRDPQLKRRERLRTLLGIYLGVFVDHPYQHQLFVELILPRRGDAATDLLNNAIQRVFAEVSEVLDAVADPGHPKVDPAFAYVAIFGMLEFFVTHRTISKTLRPPASDADEAEAYLDFMVGLFAGPDRA